MAYLSVIQKIGAVLERLIELRDIALGGKSLVEVHLVNDLPEGIRNKKEFYAILEKLEKDERILEIVYKQEPPFVTDLADMPYTACGIKLLPSFDNYSTTILSESSDKKLKAINIQKFPTPKGATWDKVIMKFVSSDTISISIGAVKKKYNYAEIGFKDERNGRSDKQWETLQKLAEYHGELSFEQGKEEVFRDPDDETELKSCGGKPSKYQRQVIMNCQKRIQELRKRLKDLMGIQEDPFFPYHQDSRKNKKLHLQLQSYKTKFEITAADSSQSVENEYPYRSDLDDDTDRTLKEE